MLTSSLTAYSDRLFSLRTVVLSLFLFVLLVCGGGGGKDLPWGDLDPSNKLRKRVNPTLSLQRFSVLPHNLLVDKLLQLLLAEVVLVLIEVKEFLGDRRGRRLVLRVVVRLEVRVLEGFLHSDALNGVERQ